MLQENGICLNNNAEISKDADLILQNPKEYAVGIQEAYGQHRTILAPPAGDAIRKFVVTQAQRIGRLNNGGRSDQEMLFFTARQEALKTLGFVYTQLQCKALGLDAKKAKTRVQKEGERNKKYQGAGP